MHYSIVLIALPLLLEAQGQQARTLPPISVAAQAALEDLSPRFASEAELHDGWFRDRAVAYYDFGPIVQPTSVGRVLWPIHGFDSHGNPVAIRGQRPIVSTIPGLDDYSGFFQLQIRHRGRPGKTQ